MIKIPINSNAIGEIVSEGGLTKTLGAILPVTGCAGDNSATLSCFVQVISREQVIGALQILVRILVLKIGIFQLACSTGTGWRRSKSSLEDCLEVWAPSLSIVFQLIQIPVNRVNLKVWKLTLQAWTYHYYLCISKKFWNPHKFIFL